MLNGIVKQGVLPRFLLGTRDISFIQSPYRLWGLCCVLFNGYMWHIPPGLKHFISPNLFNQQM